MRMKPGEGMLRQLKEREKRLQWEMARVEVQKQRARDIVTGKTKARAYVRAWLERLDTGELRHEAEMRGFLWEEVESVEQAVDMVEASMFTGVVVRQMELFDTGKGVQREE